MDEPLPGFDLYAALRVAHDAPAEVIAAAHRALVRRAHPDLHAGPEAVVTTQRLNVARDWLMDPDRRARYDRHRLGVSRPRRPARQHDRSVEVPAAIPRHILSNLEIWIARCERLSGHEVSSLSRALSRTLRERAEFTSGVDSLLQLAETKGRAGVADRAFASAIATGQAVRRADAGLIYGLRWTACAIAMSDAEPALANLVAAPWFEVVDRSDRAADRRASLGRKTRKALGRLLAAAVLAGIGVLAVAGFAALVTTLLG